MKGVKFKGIHSDALNLFMTSENRPIFSETDRFIKKVPGADGVVDFGNDTYNELHLKLSFSFNFHHDIASLRIAARDFRGWLYNDGEYHDLIFDDEPDRKYRAKVCQAVDVPPAEARTAATFKVDFVCNPPHPLLLDNTPVTPADEQARLIWDTAALEGSTYAQTFTGNGNFKFTLGGTLPVKPIIKIIGHIKPELLLSYAGQEWQYDGTVKFDEIIIDCENESVTLGSDGSNLFSHVNAIKNDFIELSPGQNSISVTGTISAFPNDISVVITAEPMEV